MTHTGVWPGVIASPFPVGEMDLESRWQKKSTNYTADLQVLGALEAIASGAADDFEELKGSDQNK